MIMASSKRRRWSLDEWRAVLARQVSSGLSAQAFCARESINASSFYRWRALCVDAQRVGPGESRVSGREVIAVRPRSQAQFVDLGSLGASSSSRLELRLDLGEGLLLTLVRG
jgi:transposase-like protein